uniref:Uncharacterized protein n=1 Tax=Meloidogyne hapla TaxID=6305 RepID=A0A1I8B2Z9_MELHA
MPSKIISPLNNNDDLPTINWFLDLSKSNLLNSNINNTKNNQIVTKKHPKNQIKLKNKQNIFNKVINPKIKEILINKDNEKIIKRNNKNNNEDKTANNNKLSQEPNQQNNFIAPVYENNVLLEQVNKQKHLDDFNNQNQNNLFNTNQTIANYDFPSYALLEHSIYGNDNFTTANSQFDYLNAGFNANTINYFGSNLITQEWEDELFQNSGNLFY